MKKFEVEIKWALIISTLSVIWFLLERIIGFHDTYITYQLLSSFTFFLVTIYLYYLALKEKDTSFYHSKMQWKQGFISAIYISFLLALFSVLCYYICYVFISPDFFENAIKNATKNNANNLENATNYFNLASYIKQGVFSSLSFGVVIGAAVSYFLTKNKK